MEVAACEISRLPDELLMAVLSLTTPLAACYAALVSRSFHAAADSDTIWSCFLPNGLPLLAAGEMYPIPLSKKEMFVGLSNRPVLLADHLTSMWLDRQTGDKCYMLSARVLNIAWGDTPSYWRWIRLNGCSFSEAAELLTVCWLEIRGKISSRMLSKGSTYAAYIVFRLTDNSRGLDYSVQEASVSIGERKLTREVCLQGYGSEYEWEEDVPPPLVPHKRDDGWMELEIGRFDNDDGDDGDVFIRLAEIKELNNKEGLIVQGIEIRIAR